MIRITCLLAAYIAAYFLILAIPSRKWVAINGKVIPDYHGIPRVFFAPIHDLDTRYIRPVYWQPFPQNQTLGYEWLSDKIQ
jgi:hypothetical protein